METHALTTVEPYALATAETRALAIVEPFTLATAQPHTLAISGDCRQSCWRWSC